MRILMLNDRIPPKNTGGAGIVMWRLAQACHQLGHDVRVIAATDGNGFRQERDGILTDHLYVEYPERLRNWFALYNPSIVGPIESIIEEFAPDVMHAHNIHHDLTWHSLTLAQNAGVPAVFTSHDVMPFATGKVTPGQRGVSSQGQLSPGWNLRHARLRYNPVRNNTIRRVLSHVMARVAVSQALADAHHANRLPRFEVVHNGVDVARYTVAPATVEAMRTRFGLQGRRVVLLAGRLTREKGVQQILATLQQTALQVPDVCLLVLSRQPIDAQVPASMRHLLADDVIRSAGWLDADEMPVAFSLADVVVTPSVYLDPFPTVNLEAMAAARPVIATSLGGSREVVQHEQTGYIVDPHDTTQFAIALTTLLQDEALRQRMGAAGRERIRQHFSLQQQTERMLAIYQRVAAHE